MDSQEYSWVSRWPKSSVLLPVAFMKAYSCSKQYTTSSSERKKLLRENNQISASMRFWLDHVVNETHLSDPFLCCLICLFMWHCLLILYSYNVFQLTEILYMIIIFIHMDLSIAIVYWFLFHNFIWFVYTLQKWEKILMWKIVFFFYLPN